MGVGITLLACFAALATVTFLECSALQKKDGFLAGEDTPVWLADYNKKQRTVSYRRYRPAKTTAVKNAMNYWNLVKRSSGFRVRKTRSVDDIDVERFSNFTRPEYDSPKYDRIKRFDSNSQVEEKPAADNEVLYPTVLVVMDHHDAFPTDDKKTRWTINELILYALAYWGTIDNSMRYIQNPRVSLRVAGIVITTSRDASYYLRWNLGEKTFVNVLPQMVDYWTSMGKKRISDFPIGSYDFVAHMTDIYPWSNYKTFTAIFPQNHPIAGVATQGPPCKLQNGIGAMIVYDSLAFEALRLATVQVTKMLGGRGEISGSFITWNKEFSEPISNALKNASCMSAPKEHYRPGKPIPAILAGELMPSGKQCEVAGYAPDAWTCWDTSIDNRRSNCRSLQCSNQHVWGVTCRNAAVTLDGTFCNAENTMICLNGMCVNKE